MRIFSDEERAQLLAENPHLKASYDDYCPTCDKTGSYTWRGVTHQCDCETQLELHKQYLAAGIGTTYQRLGWEDFGGDRKILTDVMKYTKSDQAFIKRGMGLMFLGPYGAGKTMIANLALKSFVQQGYTCFATTFAATIEMLTAGWRSADEKRRFQRRFVGSEVLLLDDVGRENTSLSETTLDSILRTRVQYGRPTFLTSNLSLDEIGQGYGGAILSLLRENSILFNFTGEDFRSEANTRTLEEIRSGQIRPII
jgi:DNA replication protein DnaC